MHYFWLLEFFKFEHAECMFELWAFGRVIEAQQQQLSPVCLLIHILEYKITLP